jgi:hypothetical protein
MARGTAESFNGKAARRVGGSVITWSTVQEEPPSVTAACHRSPIVRAPGRARTLAAATLSVAAVTSDHG